MIDAHQHFWRYDPVAYGWIGAEMAVLKRDFLPPHLWEIYQQQGIEGCVAVQARQSEAETDFLLALAVENDFIKGVVGWLDLRSENLVDRLHHYAQFAQLKGIRHIVQDEPDENFMLGEAFQRGIGQLHAFGLTYDLLVFPHQLKAAIQTVRNFPNQAFVLDHIAKPYIAKKLISHWERDVRELASLPNVCCKVSGMVTETDWQNWQYEDFLPYLNVVFEVFGPERIMFGSDWPVCTLAGDYGAVKGIVDRYLESFSSSEKELVFRINAERFYGL